MSDARIRHKLAIFLLTLGILLALVITWSWGPLKSMLNVDQVVATLRQAGNTHGSLAAVFTFAVASTLGVPLIFLTLVSLVAFGPVSGTVITLAGGAIGASISFMAGKQLGQEVLGHYGGQKLNIISQRLGKRGMIAAATLRLVPIAPFAVVNMVAGTSHIRLRDFIIGSTLGMLPGTTLLALFVDSFVASLAQPSQTGWWLVAITLLLIVAGMWLLRRWLARIEQDTDHAA